MRAGAAVSGAALQTSDAKGRGRGGRQLKEAAEELLLLGNPNAGKSTLFNALTGGHARVGNWHGVTVTALEGEAVLGGRQVKVCDLPGVYAEEGLGMEERTACELIMGRKKGIICLVSECAALHRSLRLLLSLAEGRRAVLVLTKKRQFLRRGGRLEEDALERLLGIPVMSAEGLSPRALRERMAEALGRAAVPRLANFGGEGGLPRGEAFGGEGGLPGVYAPARAGLTKLDAFLLHPAAALAVFLLLLLAAFWLTFAPFGPGGLLKGLIEGLFAGKLYALAQAIPSPVLRSFVGEGLILSVGGVLCFLPQIGMLFLFLTLLEESGLLSRLAFFTDGTLSRAGLSGRAVFSLLMGFGCTAAAILSTRGLDDRAMQRRVILCLPYLSCSAKLPVYLTLASSFFPDPFLAALLLYVLGAGLSFAVLLFLGGERGAPFVLEFAPLQVPALRSTLKALCFQLKQFIMKLGTVILAFFIASWLLSSFDFSFRFCAVEESMLAHICGGLEWLFAPVGMKDWRIAYAALSGLVAKENVAGALELFFPAFPYGARSAFALAVFVLASSPCVSAVAAAAREVGLRRALLYAAMQTGSALFLCYLVYFLTGGLHYALPLFVIAFLLLFFGRNFRAGIHHRRGNVAQKLHRRA